jgi:DNA-binding transcriptional regulator LsrR (DeoR family)
MRKPKREITDDERIDIALKYYKPGITLKALQQQFQRHPSTLSRAMTEAFEQGLVEVKKVERAHYRQDADLEEQLKESFKIQLPLVVDTEIRQNLGDAALAGDKVHAILGSVAASLITKGALFRPNDVIGVGSGRGVFHTIESLEQHRLGVPNITLVSLTGNVGARSHAQKINVQMDADTHVDMLSKSFSQKIESFKISSLVSHRDTAVLKALREETWLSTTQWRAPTIALIGVGTMGPGHRFYELANSNDTPQPMFLALKEDLQNLIKLCKKIQSVYGDYCPVGDICNNLFFVTPPSHVRVSSHDENEIRSTIKGINSKLLNIDDDQLQQIDNLMMVAGTAQKALAIRELLVHRGYKIRILCTDVAAAKSILAHK